MAVSTIDNNGVNLGQLGNRSSIINGAMTVSQRGVSFTANGYTLDRWVLASNNTAPTVTQETGVFATGGKSIKMITDASNGYAYVAQKVEDLSYFSGKTITVSFDYKATNNFWLQFEYHYGSGGSTPEYTKHQTAISSSATATRASVTVTIDDLSAKTFGSASTSYLKLLFNSEIANPTTVEITNVQLEVGDTSTPFEHRSFDQENTLCQRYFQRYGAGATDGRIGVGGWNNSTSADMLISLTHEMRVTPTVSAPSKGRVLDFAVAWYPITSFITGESTSKTVNIGATISGTSAAAQGDVAFLGGGGGAFDYQMDAEL